MRRVALVGLALLAVLAAAQSGSAKTRGRFSVVGLTGDAVSRVDSVTLKPMGRSLAIPFPWSATALSPDRRILAIGANNSGRVRLVDVRQMRTLADLHVASNVAERLVWLSPQLVVVEVQTPAGTRLIALDSRTRVVRWRVAVDGQLLQIERFASGLVLLAAPADHIGQAQLVEVGASGQTRSVVLETTLAGSSWPDDPLTGVGDIRTPGLVVDPSRDHAYVFGAGEPIADVDLSSLAVVYHGGNRTLAKAFSGWYRQAIWLGQGTIAVTGLDFTASVVADGTESQTMTPAGLTFVDTTTWASRSADASVADVVRSGKVLVATGSTYSTADKTAHGEGLSFLSLDGTRRAHLFGQTLVFATSVVHALAYSWLSNGHMAVTNPANGQMLTNRPSRLVEIL